MPITSHVLSAHLSSFNLVIASHERFASLKALQAPLEDVDRAFLSQFISIMRRDGTKVLFVITREMAGVRESTRVCNAFCGWLR